MVLLNPSQLAVDGQALMVEAAFTLAPNTNVKAISLNWGTDIAPFYALSTSNVSLKVSVTIIRTGATTQRILVSWSNSAGRDRLRYPDQIAIAPGVEPTSFPRPARRG
jgi:hypothetical protein